MRHLRRPRELDPEEGKAECVCLLDKFHRNKKLTECIKAPAFLQTAKTLLYANRIGDLVMCIEAQINSTESVEEQAGLRELLSYYSENRNAMTGRYECGIGIPETRAPRVIHHARLGSMESNVFTIIGNCMKGQHCCWSIRGGYDLADLLCLNHSVGLDGLFIGPAPLP